MYIVKEACTKRLDQRRLSTCLSSRTPCTPYTFQKEARCSRKGWSKG